MKIFTEAAPVTSYILGLDLSLTGTGIAVLKNGQFLETELVNTKAVGMERLAQIEHRVYHYIQDMQIRKGPKFAVIEGYGFASQKGVALGELGGLVRLILWRNGIRSLIVAPPTLKKFVTGKGVGDKGQISKDIYKHWKIDVDNNNLADACALAVMGYHWLCPDMFTQKWRKEALSKISIIEPKMSPTVPPRVELPAVRIRSRLQPVASQLDK